MRPMVASSRSLIGLSLVVCFSSIEADLRGDGENACLNGLGPAVR